MSKLRVGLVGCGRISDIYLKNLANFKEVSVTACASLDINETRLKAEQYNIAKIFSVEEIMADPDIDCILNLTIPAAHAEITLQALNNGKHVYSEKPFVTQLKDGLAILENLTHRGAVGADPKAGDGCGILTRITDEFLRKLSKELDFDLPKLGEYGVGNMFLPKNDKKRADYLEKIKNLISEENLERKFSAYTTLKNIIPLNFARTGLFYIIKKIIKR